MMLSSGLGRGKTNQGYIFWLNKHFTYNLFSQDVIRQDLKVSVCSWEDCAQILGQLFKESLGILRDGQKSLMIRII